VAVAEGINNSCIAAGIDIGSNTFRLLVARVENDRLTTLDKELATVRLGHNVTTSMVLAPEAIARALPVLQLFNDILNRWQPRHIRVCGTAALRMADNSDEFLRLAQKTLGVPIEIISGSEEAILGLAGATAFMEKKGPDPMLLVDVGGGSTEVAFAVEGSRTDPGSDNPAPRIVSLPLGVVSLTEDFLHQPVATAEESAQMTEHIRKQLAAGLQKIAPVMQRTRPLLIGNGGSATSMAALDLDLIKYNERKVQGHILSRSRLAELWQRLAILSAAERNLLPGLQDGRGEILLAGIRIYQVLLELLDLQQLKVSDAGLLEGILLSGLPNVDRH
jgi:exopolyphosphatase/guanosine-5'-triphosphate,3'-diphosphate pyrophosphatase